MEGDKKAKPLTEKIILVYIAWNELVEEEIINH